MGEVPSSVRARDRRRGNFFYPRVNLSGIKFISSLLRRLAFRTGCVRVYLQKIRVWKHESSLEYINFWIDFTRRKYGFWTRIHTEFIEIKFLIFSCAQFVFHERPEDWRADNLNIRSRRNDLFDNHYGNPRIRWRDPRWRIIGSREKKHSRSDRTANYSCLPTDMRD